MLNTSSSPVLTNCWFSRNESNYFGGGIYTNDGTPTLINCILWGNTAPNGTLTEQQVSGLADATYSCIEGGLAGAGNMSGDPLAADPDGPDNVVGTPDDDLHLTAASPCVNTGSNIAPNLPANDFDGEDRMQNCRVDMGADESPYAPASFADCNSNGLDDDCDVYHATSPDCNTNEVPDECEALAFSMDSVCSSLPHGDDGELCLQLGPTLAHPWIEPRFPGVRKLICQMSSTVDEATALPENIQVNCANTAYTGAVDVALQGDPCPNTDLVITFEPALPDQDCCTITLDGVLSVGGLPVSEALPVRPLRGDVNRNGTTTTGDALIIKPRFGMSAVIAGAEYDYNASGTVTAADFLQIKLLFGNTAPACP